MGSRESEVEEWKNGGRLLLACISLMAHLGFLFILNEQADSPEPNTALARKSDDDRGLGMANPGG